ncbi:MAG TPA: SDR family oxidoreductase [Candidatus Saccharimonadales bacterium]|nr:SDR family oxidoreductase [Candidatus Saccharimonadales bacterium]
MNRILITGGNDGLGRATAEALMKAGHHVTILGRDEARTKQAAAELKCNYVVADVTDYAQVEKAIQAAESKGGPLDILINNAGQWIQDALETNDPARIKAVVETNTLGTIYCTRAAVTAMKARQKGRIINVISQAGLSAKAERAVYNASKWAITGFTKSMQLELKPAHIAVTGFYPGAINTGLFDKSGNSRDMSRALDPKQAAEMLAFICNLPENVDVPEIGMQNLDY